MLEPQIVQKPALIVVGLETAFIHALSPETDNFKVIPPLWDAICHRASEIRHRVGTEMYGIIYSRPERARVHPHELQYIAGVAASQAGDIPSGMISRAIPAGTFAL